MSEKGPLSEAVEKVEQEIGLLAPISGGVCARCRIEYPHVPKDELGALCRSCQDVEREAAGIIAARDRIVSLELRDAGLEQRERLAELARIPAAISRRIPQGPLREMLAGGTPDVGFGLSGTAGIGKSMAVAAIVAEMARKRVERIARSGGYRKLRGWLQWLAWKEMTEQFRAWSTEDGGLARANGLVERWGEIEVLVIDDLGSERIKGSYLDDWATSQLDRILDARDRSCRPVWYTSNLSAAALEERYGSRFWSRLNGAATHVELPAAADLRLVRGGA